MPDPRPSPAVVVELCAWACWPALVTLGLALGSDGFGAASDPSVALAAVVASVLGVAVARLYARGRGREAEPRGPSPADRVTFVRVGLTCAVAGVVGVAAAAPLLPSGGPGPDAAGPGGLAGRVPSGGPLEPTLVAVVAASLLLDLLDGPLARWRRVTTRLGARFDMEADAFVIAVLSLAAAPRVGAWVLAIGGARYAFGLAALACPWLSRDLAPSRARKVVAAAQALALFVAVSGVAPLPVARAACALALAALTWSFARDVVRLWRARTPGTPWHRLSPRATATLKALAGAAILVAVVARVGAGPFVSGLAALTPGVLVYALVIALVIGLVTTLGSAARWSYVAHRLDVRLTPVEAVVAYYRALFLNASLPAGVVGDAERAWRHGRSSGSPGGAVRAVVVERGIGQVALFLVTAAVVAVPMSGNPLTPVGGALTAAGVVAAVALAAILLRRPLVGRYRTELRRLLAPDTWPQLTALSLLVVAGHVAMFVVAARAVGIDRPVTILLPLFLLALVAMGLPLNVGGWGPREGVTAWAFHAVGLDAGLGLQVAVAYGALAFVASLPGLPAWLLGRRARPAT